MFIVLRPLEVGRDADGERSVRGIRALVDAAELIALVAGRPEGAPSRQGRIEPGVSGDREQGFRLDIDAGDRDPADQARPHGGSALQRAQPHGRSFPSNLGYLAFGFRALPGQAKPGSVSGGTGGVFPQMPSSTTDLASN